MYRRCVQSPVQFLHEMNICYRLTPSFSLSRDLCSSIEHPILQSHKRPNRIEPKNYETKSTLQEDSKIFS